MKVPARLLVLAGSSLSFLLCPRPGWAQRLEEVSARADCAQVELSTALGEKVSQADVARCSAQARQPTPVLRPPPLKDPKTPREGYFQPPPSADSGLQPVVVRPDWLDGKGAEGRTIYGVGVVTRAESATGNERQVAMQRAIFEIAAQVQVRIDSASTDSQSMRSAEVTTPDGRTRSVAASSQAFSTTTQLLVQASLDGLQFVAHYRDPKSGTYWVLVSLDQAALEASQDAIVEAVLAAMASAAEQVSAALKADTLSQEVIFGLADALDQANAVGRTTAGRKLKARWKGPQEQLLRTAKRLVSCLDVFGGYVDEQNSLVELQVSCAGKPLRNARLLGKLDGGVFDLPASLTTTGDGVLRFRPGTVHGKQSAKVVFQHDLEGTRAGALLGEPRPSQRAALALPATAEALASAGFVGLPAESPEAEKVMLSVAAFLDRRFGIRLARDGDLKVVVTVSVGSAVSVGSQVSQPIELNVTLSGSRGRILEKSARTAGLASTPAASLTQAVQRVVDGMRTW